MGFMLAAWCMRARARGTRWMGAAMRCAHAHRCTVCNSAAPKLRRAARMRARLHAGGVRTHLCGSTSGAGSGRRARSSRARQCWRQQSRSCRRCRRCARRRRSKHTSTGCARPGQAVAGVCWKCVRIHAWVRRRKGLAHACMWCAACMLLTCMHAHIARMHAHCECCTRLGARLDAPWRPKHYLC